MSLAGKGARLKSVWLGNKRRRGVMPQHLARPSMVMGHEDTAAQSLFHDWAFKDDKPRVWTGHGWYYYSAKYWNGAWTVKTTKYWNGSSWVTA